MTSKLTREELLNIIETDHVQCGEASALARMALDAMDSEPVELPLDYLQGHKHGLEWAAQLAKANHPETGDWLYDDPIELAKAISKGPDMPPSQPVPVVPDVMEPTIEAIKRILPTSNPDDYAACIGADMWNACRAAMLQAGTLANRDTRQVDELTMWIKRLVRSLKNANPDSKLPRDAMDYLTAKGLISVGDILR